MNTTTNLSATPDNTTTTTTQTPGQPKTHTVTLNTPPAPALTAADKLRAKLAAGAAAKTASQTPITPKALFIELDKPGTVERFIDAALDGTEAAPLVILASHVNRSENLKAAAAAIKYADIAARYAPKYGLTIPEFIRLLAKLVIQDYSPAALEAEPEAPQQQDDKQDDKQDEQQQDEQQKDTGTQDDKEQDDKQDEQQQDEQQKDTGTQDDKEQDDKQDTGTQDNPGELFETAQTPAQTPAPEPPAQPKKSAAHTQKKAAGKK